MCGHEEKEENRVRFSNPHRVLCFYTINKLTYFPHKFLFLLFILFFFLMWRIIFET